MNRLDRRKARTRAALVAAARRLPARGSSAEALEEHGALLDEITADYDDPACSSL
ncbi:hypothetical protein [Lentzea nigeriaca]|uniref:hypothetical protein n=1 Tax=Lentzea nigeriaca TaxID=1128665 RepID=UPI0019574114|nr:hypothetical protein [Lentzea nigeriaca]MBM7857264.1 hypothetical protein [Lentzea nigeriaca]